MNLILGDVDGGLGQGDALSVLGEVAPRTGHGGGVNMLLSFIAAIRGHLGEEGVSVFWMVWSFTAEPGSLELFLVEVLTGIRELSKCKEKTPTGTFS